MRYLNTSHWIQHLTEWRSRLTPASLCSCLLLCLLGFVTLYQIVCTYQLLSARTPAVQMPTSLQKPSPWQQLAEKHFFGHASIQEDDSSLPESDTRLKLQGILVSTNHSKAILKDFSGTEQIYSEGAQLSDGTILEKIYPNYIVIRYNDMREKLTLIKPL